MYLNWFVASPARATVWIAWAFWFVGFGLLSVWLPRDIGYDVLHYHLHNGWSAYHGRLRYDLAPAEMHSFINPVYNLFVWWLIEVLPGRGVAFVLGLIQALLLPSIYWVTHNLLRAAGWRPRWELSLILAVMGFLSAPNLSLISSVRNDYIGAWAFAIALALAIPPVRSRFLLVRFALGAFLIGAAVGMKLTNFVYVAGYASAVLVASEGYLARVKATGICALCGLGGIAMLGGPWMWTLWQAFGNPVFPFFQDLFSGSDMPQSVSRDIRYIPASLFEAVSLPFRASFQGDLINEFSFVDLRLASLYGAALGLLGLACLRSGDRSNRPNRQVIALVVAVLATLFVWIWVYAILRYATGLYGLAPLLVALLAGYLGFGRLRSNEIARRVAIGGVFLIATTTLTFGQTFRVPWSTASTAYWNVERPEGPGWEYENALVLLAASFPSGAMATGFPEARLTHIDALPWSRPFLDSFRPRIETAVATHDGPIYMVAFTAELIQTDNTGRSRRTIYGIDQVIESRSGEYLLRRHPVGCGWLRTGFDTNLFGWEICRLERPAHDITDNGDVGFAR